MGKGAEGRGGSAFIKFGGVVSKRINVRLSGRCADGSGSSLNCLKGRQGWSPKPRCKQSNTHTEDTVYEKLKEHG